MLVIIGLSHINIKICGHSKDITFPDPEECRHNTDYDIIHGKLRSILLALFSICSKNIDGDDRAPSTPIQCWDNRFSALGIFCMAIPYKMYIIRAYI